MRGSRCVLPLGKGKDAPMGPDISGTHEALSLLVLKQTLIKTF